MSEIESKLTETELITLHRRSMSRTLMAGRCGCYHCLSTFLAETVSQWCDDGQTALCPVCGIDAALSEIGQDLSTLEQMHDRWFRSSTRIGTQSEWDHAVTTNTLPG